MTNRKASDRPLNVRQSACEACGDDFTAKIDHGVWPRFCSRTCFLSNCVRPENKECGHCGSVFLATRSATANSEDGRRIYCSVGCAAAANRSSTERPCRQCGRLFYPANVTKNQVQQTCSAECMIAYFTAERSAAFKGGRYTVAATGNKFVYVGKDAVGSGSHMAEHRLIASRAIGRPLTRDEFVVRVSRDPDNNDPANLFICESNSEFSKRRNGSLSWPTESNLGTYGQKRP